MDVGAPVRCVQGLAARVRGVRPEGRAQGRGAHGGLRGRLLGVPGMTWMGVFYDRISRGLTWILRTARRYCEIRPTPRPK